MLQLTPLEETVAGKELILKGKDEGREEGRVEGREEGILIGSIQTMGKVLNKKIPSREELAEKNLGELQAILDILNGEPSP